MARPAPDAIVEQWDRARQGRSRPELRPCADSVVFHPQGVLSLQILCAIGRPSSPPYLAHGGRGSCTPIVAGQAPAAPAVQPRATHGPLATHGIGRRMGRGQGECMVERSTPRTVIRMAGCAQSTCSSTQCSAGMVAVRVEFLAAFLVAGETSDPPLVER